MDSLQWVKQSFTVVLPLVVPSLRGTFGLHRRWLLWGSFPLLSPARIYIHNKTSQQSYKKQNYTDRAWEIFSKIAKSLVLQHLHLLCLNLRTTQCWPKGWIWRLPLHNREEACEEALLPITHQTSVCVDQSLHFRDVSLHGYGTEFIQFLAI